MKKLCIIASVIIIQSVFSSSLLAANENGVYSLPGFEKRWTSTDLDPLKTIIGDAQYVGLGESVHATEGFSQAKLRVIKYLVEHENFRAIAMETPWINSHIAADYISTCHGTAKQALNGIFAVWWSRSVEDLFSWLCEFNHNHPADPVTFYGFDTQNTPMDIFSDLQNRLSIVAPQQSEQLMKGLSTCFAYGLTLSEYVELENKIEAGNSSISAIDNGQCLRGIDTLDTQLAQLDSNDINVKWAKIDSVGIRSNQGEYYYMHSDEVKSYESRDSGMAYELQALHAITAPAAKTIIWAHNIHLALDYNAVKVSFMAPNPFINMGTLLSQSLQANYVPIALTGYKVGIHWPGQNVDEFPTPSGQSVEYLLHQTNYQNAILDLSKNFLTLNQLYDLGGDTLIPNQQFKGLIYLDTCGPMLSPESG